MNIRATSKTAAITGAWTASGMLLFESLGKYGLVSAEFHNKLLFAFAIIFFIVPSLIFVVGPKYSRYVPISRKSENLQNKWAEFRLASLRMIFWAIGALLTTATFLIAFKLVGVS